MSTRTRVQIDPAALMAVRPARIEEITSLPLFQGITPKVLENLMTDIQVCEAPAGAIVCKQGAYGETAFYIVKGSVEVHIAAPVTRDAEKARRDIVSGATAQRGRKGLKRFAHGLTSFIKHKRQSDNRIKPEGHLDTLFVGGQDSLRTARHIDAIDLPVALRVDKPFATLKEGELFGEMSALSKYPRSATVTAGEPSVLIQLTGRVLSFAMKRNKAFKDEIDQRYRNRALASHLRNVDLFKNVPEEVLDRLRQAVHFVACEPGEVIFEEGAQADSFYLIRAGFVKVSRRNLGGGEMILAYLSRGSYFGEISLLRDTPRTATVTAFDHVELVQIMRSDFQRLVADVPELANKLTVVADRRMQETHALSDQVQSSMMLQFAVDSGILNAESLLLIDLNKCTRCDDCTDACASIHGGQTRLIRSGPVFLNFLLPTSCRQCSDPVCMVGCPTGAIARAESGQIEIKDTCIGCDNCAKRCPYGTIIMVEDKHGDKIARKAAKCDLCAGEGHAACVYNCPHGAAMRVNPADLFNAVSEVL